MFYIVWFIEAKWVRMNDANTHHAQATAAATAPRIRRRGCARRGFTLIEAALATVIIGTGVLSILAAQQAYHRKNQWASKSGTAMLLANEIRELTMHMPFHDPITANATLGPEAGETTIANFDDLDDFAGNISFDRKGSGTIFASPELQDEALPSGMPRHKGPINALRQTIPDMEGWSQVVKVENVQASNIASTLYRALDDPDPGVMRITVQVLYKSPQDEQAQVFGTLTWIVTPE